MGLIAAWHPLLWWCCGGRWGALLGELRAVGRRWFGGRSKARGTQLRAPARIAQPASPNIHVFDALLLRWAFSRTSSLPPCRPPHTRFPAGTAGEVLPVARLLGRSVWSHVALYPLACLALRLAATPLLPYWRIPAAPLLFVLRHTVWTPRWWLSGPASGGLCWAAMRAEARDAESFPLYLGALFLVAAW